MLQTEKLVDNTEGEMMGCVLPAVREEKIHYRPHRTERIGNSKERIRIIQQMMGQKDTGLVPKGWHFGLQFLLMGGASLGWLAGGKAKEFIQSLRTAAKNYIVGQRNR
jgi:hypothetical protein